jgi:integrase
MRATAGSITFFRQPKPSTRWKDPAVPEYDPSWLASISMPGQPRERRMRPELPICETCLAHVGNPAKDRPHCECVKAARKWAKEELATRTYLLQQGKIKELQEMRCTTHATPQKVMWTYEERGPKDAKARINALKWIYEQATGKPVKLMRWADLTEDLVLGWAELRQEAGRRGWLGLKDQRKMPDNGWQILRELKASGSLPALDRRTPMACNTSIHSYITQARTIFGQESRQHILRGLRIPELKGFMKVVVTVKKPVGHKKIAKDKWEAMIEAEPALKKENLRAWVVHELLLRLSCRPVEVLAARPGWLEKVETKGGVVRWRIMIINRPDESFTLKSGSGARERAIWLPDALVEAIHQIAQYDSLIGAKHITEAKEILAKHSKWMRKFVPKGSSQTNYLLRHSGAAERMTSGDSTQAMALLGHKTTQMVETTYGAVLETLEPISDDEILRRVG